ncbi:MAG: hypothetical protein Q8P20_00420 [bacterium]|nr:hypothetical protein [bacterium]
MIVDSLSKEIIKRIFADVGVVPGPMFGKVGLVEPRFKIAKTITVRYDDMDRAHDVYAGKMSLGESTLRGVLVNLTVDYYPEFLCVFRMDELPIHAIKVVYDSSNDSFFKIFNNETKIWREANVYMKARMLADFEQIVSAGLLWQDCDNTEDLYTAIISLIQ